MIEIRKPFTNIEMLCLESKLLFEAEIDRMKTFNIYNDSFLTLFHLFLFDDCLLAQRFGETCHNYERTTLRIHFLFGNIPFNISNQIYL